MYLILLYHRTKRMSCHCGKIKLHCYILKSVDLAINARQDMNPNATMGFTQVSEPKSKPVVEEAAIPEIPRTLAAESVLRVLLV